MATSFFSQAPSNFGNAAQGNVDARTGQYVVDLQFSRISANNGMGPDLPLKITYSPFSSQNTHGLGIGWALGVSLYDRTNKLLCLSSGEQYKTTESADGENVYLMQNPATNYSLKFIKISDKEYHYISKTGEIEILTPDGLTPDIFACSKIVTPVGYVLDLKWALSGSQIHLIKVSDENVTLCEFEYAGSITINVWPDTSDAYSIQLEFKNNILSSYSITALSLFFKWILGYSTVGNYTLLTSIKHPTGYQESVSYTQNIMAFPGNTQPALPAVTQYLQAPGAGQPTTKTIYTYSTNNYLGHNGVTPNDWRPDQDNLYIVLSDYIYTTTENVTDDYGRSKITTRNFNNYHLLVNETITQGSCTRVIDVEYYATIGIPLDQQLPQFQQRKSITTTWTDSTESSSQRREIITSAYDEFGNRLSHQKSAELPTGEVVSGKLISWEYYTESGEPDAGSTGCPPDPNGFVCRVKRRTLQPAQSNYNDEFAEVVTYKFADFPSRPGGPASTFVQLVRTTVSQNGTLTLASNEIEYDSSSNYGRISTVTSVICDGIKAYPRTLSITYDNQTETLDRTVTFSGYDGTTWTEKRSNSAYSQKLLSATDKLGNQTTYSYDGVGRVISRTHNSQTEYANILTISYSSPNSGGTVSDNSMTYNDPSGNILRIDLDGKNRAIRCSRNSGDEKSPTQLLPVASLQYGIFGVPINLTEIDYPDPSTQGKVFNTSVDIFYDDWGRQYMTKHNTGQIDYRYFDPINFTLTSQLQTVSQATKLGMQVTSFSPDMLPVRQTRYDSSGAQQATSTNDYDGYDRLRRAVDETDNVTTYSYDYFNRLTHENLPDNTCIVRQYAPYSATNWVMAINVTCSGVNVSLGTQTFDGLGRITKTIKGGRIETRGYSGASENPQYIEDAMGVQLQYQYVPELQDAIRSTTGTELAQNFEYDSLTSRSTSLREVGSLEQTLAWSKAGLLTQETFIPASGPQLQSSYTWTLMGKPLSATGIDGTIETATYDNFGRLVGVVDSDVSVALEYDDAGRPAKQVAIDTHTGAWLSTKVGYDDWSREITRELSTSTSVVLTITRDYFPNDQLKSRVTSIGSDILRNETFVYDNRNRLISYSCTGSQPPVDGYGQRISSQTFTHDFLNNITQCITESIEEKIDTAVFTYGNLSDPTQLTSITHSGSTAYPSKITLSYDANGRMIKDAQDRTMVYDQAGRLASITSADGINCSEYQYDAKDMLVTQILNHEDIRQLYYRGSSLINEVRLTQGRENRFIKLKNSTVAVSDQSISTSRF